MTHTHRYILHIGIYDIHIQKRMPYTDIFTFTHTHIHTGIYATHTCTGTYDTYTQAYMTHTHTGTYATHRHICIHTYTCTYIQTHMSHTHTRRHICHTHVGTYVAHTNIFSHTHREKKKRLAGGTVHRSPWPPLKSFLQRLWELRKILNIRQP